MSELLEPTGAGQQGSRPLPYPAGTDPTEDTRGEGWPGIEGQSWDRPHGLKKEVPAECQFWGAWTTKEPGRGAGNLPAVSAELVDWWFLGREWPSP